MAEADLWRCAHEVRGIVILIAPLQKQIKSKR